MSFLLCKCLVEVILSLCQSLDTQTEVIPVAQAGNRGALAYLFPH